MPGVTKTNSPQRETAGRLVKISRSNFNQSQRASVESDGKGIIMHGAVRRDLLQQW